MLGALLCVVVLAASAEPLADKVEREYAIPVLEQVKTVAAGNPAPEWSPPTGPMTPAALKLTNFLRSLTDPLALHAETQAGAAARSLGSPTAEYKDVDLPTLDFQGMITRWMIQEGLLPEPQKTAEKKPDAAPAAESKRADSVGFVKGRYLGGDGKARRLSPYRGMKATEITPGKFK